jgi:hypothetical protein
MGEINVTQKIMDQRGMTLSALPPGISLLKSSLIETNNSTNKKRAIEQYESPRTALNQLGNGYFGEDDKGIRSSWDVSVCVYCNFKLKRRCEA